MSIARQMAELLDQDTRAMSRAPGGIKLTDMALLGDAQRRILRGDEMGAERVLCSLDADVQEQISDAVWVYLGT